MWTCGKDGQTSPWRWGCPPSDSTSSPWAERRCRDQASNSQRRLDDLQGVAEQALALARAAGLDHAEAAASEDVLEVNVRRGGRTREEPPPGLSMRVILDGRVAASATTDVGPDALEAFVARLADWCASPRTLSLPPTPREQNGTWEDLDCLTGPRRASTPRRPSPWPRAPRRRPSSTTSASPPRRGRL